MFNSALKAFYTQTPGSRGRLCTKPITEPCRRRGCSEPARGGRHGEPPRPQQDFGQDHIWSVLNLTPVTGEGNSKRSFIKQQRALVPGAGGELATQPGIAPIATMAPGMGTLPDTPKPWCPLPLPK